MDTEELENYIIKYTKHTRSLSEVIRYISKLTDYEKVDIDRIKNTFKMLISSRQIQKIYIDSYNTAYYQSRPSNFQPKL